MTNYGIESAYPTGDFISNIELTDKISNLPTYSTVDVDSRMQGRLDLISYECYGTTDLWWVIALVNNIQDPYSFTNTKLNLPSKKDINSLLQG